MKKHKKQLPQTYTFDRKVEMTVTPVEPKFTLNESCQYLDLKLISKKAKARVELGTVAMGGCKQTVCAIVKKGMVEGIELEPCKEAGAQREKLDPKLLKLLASAQRAIGKRSAQTTQFPMVLDDVISNPRIIVESWTCVRICFFGWCFVCCWGTNPLGRWGLCAPSRFTAE